MKTMILFIIILFSAVMASCQETAFADLTEKTSTSGADEFTVVSGGSPYRMSNSTLFSKTTDSLSVYRDSIDNLDARILSNDADILSGQILTSAAFDSIYRHTDTAKVHNNRLKVLESGGGGSCSFGTTTQIPYMNAGGTDFIYNSGLTFDGVTLKSTKSIESDTVHFTKTVDSYITNEGSSLRFMTDAGSYTSLDFARLIGGRGINSLIHSPTVTQDGYSITWNNSSNEYTLTDAGESASIKTMYAASIGRGLTGDTAHFQTGATYQRFWYAGPDSIQLDSARAVCDDNDSSVDIDYNIIFQEERISGSWSNVWTTAVTVSGADAITTGEKTTTFTIDKIPPYSWIELIFEETTVKPTSFSVNLIGHYIQ